MLESARFERERVRLRQLWESGNVRVLLVIPVLNEVQNVERIVRQLIANTHRAALRVVIVDGGSTDGTIEVVQALTRSIPNLELIDNTGRIQSVAVNLAVERCGHETNILIRCDAHANYPDDYCDRLVETLIAQDADAVVVPLDSVGEGLVHQAIAWTGNLFIGTGGSAHRGGRRSGFVDHGHHAAFGTEVFRRVGGYDETYTHNEDAEFDCRQRALGSRIYLDCSNRVSYHPRTSFLKLWKQYVRYGEGRSRTARRHPSSVRLRQIAVPLHLFLMLVTSVLGAWYPLLLAWPVAYLSVLAITASVVAIRKRKLSGVLVAPAAAIMHTAWGLGFYWGLIRHREAAWTPEAAAPIQIAAPLAGE